MIDSDEAGPINLGNPEERTVTERAALVLELVESESVVEHHPLPVDEIGRAHV